MPVCEADPWRLQYFAAVPCPEGVNIPTEDADAWCWYPAFRWVYDKLAIAQSQGLACGPHGVMPAAFPVFSKPLINLRGMGMGARVLRDEAEYRRHSQPGHMWMALLNGEHISTDAAIVGGRAAWFRHAHGSAAGGGTFDRWVVEAGARTALEQACGAWIARYLAGYCGMVNFETIGGTIIEVHLRFADQWPDLYGRGWVEALIGLYARAEWRFADDQRRPGYSIVLFGPHGVRYRHPPPAEVERIRDSPAISSVQITFHEDRDPIEHAMPPGGFRLAIVNCWSLAAGLQARRELARAFGLEALAARRSASTARV